MGIADQSFRLRLVDRIEIETLPRTLGGKPCFLTPRAGDVPFVVETVSGLAGLSLQFELAASEPVGIARVKPQWFVYALGTVWLPSVSPTEILRSANSVEMTSASSGSLGRSSALISEGMSA